MFKLQKGEKVGLLFGSRATYDLDDDFFEDIKKFEELYDLKVHLEEDIGLPIYQVSPQTRASHINKLIKNSEIRLILAHGGGNYANELLPYIDYDSLKNSNKTFCGFSDNTIWTNAFYTKSGITTFNGPNFRTFVKPNYFKHTLDFFEDIFFKGEKEIILENWKSYYDFSKGAERLICDGGIQVLQEGKSDGILVGGNISTLGLLYGTEYMPDLDGKILFLEECDELIAPDIRRVLYQIKMQKGFENIQGVIFGRFNRDCQWGKDLELDQTMFDIFGDLDIPIIKNALFGHISPFQTIPTGSRCTMNTKTMNYKIQI